MTAADLTAITGVFDPVVIVGGIVAFAALLMAPRAARMAWDFIKSLR